MSPSTPTTAPADEALLLEQWDVIDSLSARMGERLRAGSRDDDPEPDVAMAVPGEAERLAELRERLRVAETQRDELNRALDSAVRERDSALRRATRLAAMRERVERLEAELATSRAELTTLRERLEDTGGAATAPAMPAPAWYAALGDALAAERRRLESEVERSRSARRGFWGRLLGR